MTKHQFLKKLWNWLIQGQCELDLILLMSCILLILYSNLTWYINLPELLLGISGLLFPMIRKHPRFWFIAGIIMFGGCLVNFYSADNHKWLLSYWCLTLYIVLEGESFKTNLAQISKLLIGLSFAFASIWKIRSPDFLSGDFFLYTIITDDRFKEFAAWFGGISIVELTSIKQSLSNLIHPLSGSIEFSFIIPQSLIYVSKFITWWTIIIELLIAVLFLIPKQYSVHRLRNPLLIIFILTTYSFAPVIGFGWLLLIMALSQTEKNNFGMKLSFVLLFIFLQLYQSPWKAVIDVSILNS